jgi:hypothetical protein
VSRTRPTLREIQRRLDEAKQCARDNRFQFLALDEIIADLDELAIDLDNFDRELKTILEEIQPSCYRGQRPPQKSYEAEIHELDLWAFSWHSARFRRQIYFKFALTKADVKHLWLVSLHVDRPNR